MQRWVGIDVGLRNLAFAFIEVDPEKEGWERFQSSRVMNVQHHDLGTTNISDCLKELMGRKELMKLLRRAHKVVIEAQLGRTNPKMFAMSHLLESLILAQNKRDVQIEFKNARLKYKAFAAWGYKPVVKITKKLTRSQKYNATKKNSLALGEFIMEHGNVHKKADVAWKGFDKKQRTDVSDALGIVYL